MGLSVFSGVVLGVMVCAQGVIAGVPQDQKQEIQGIIKEYLIQNPEVVAQSLIAYQDQQNKARQEKAGAAILKHKASLEAAHDDAVLGNAQGSRVMVAFLDPFCGHCRAFHKVMEEALQKEPELKIIVKSTPIFGQPSILAVKALMAAHRQGFYAQASAYMDQADPKQTLEDIATALKVIKGFDVLRFKKDMASADLEKSLEGTIDLAEKIGVNATPTLVVNGRFVEGGMSYDDLKKLLDRKA